MVQSIPGDGAGRLGRREGDDFLRHGRGREQTAVNACTDHLSSSVASNEPGRQRGGYPRAWLRIAAVHPNSRVDPPDPVKEQYDAGQCATEVRIDRTPVSSGHL